MADIQKIHELARQAADEIIPEQAGRCECLDGGIRDLVLDLLASEFTRAGEDIREWLPLLEQPSQAHTVAAIIGPKLEYYEIVARVKGAIRDIPACEEKGRSFEIAKPPARVIHRGK